MDDPALRAALGEIANCSLSTLRAEAVHILSRMLERRAAQMVVEALRDESTVVRLRALSGIVYVCDKAALPAVEKLIAREKSSEVLHYAMEVADRLRGDLPCAPLPLSEDEGK
jgi:HEAT repeat protein